ncbi:MAG: hypothetical protein AB7U61_01200, partial [Methylocystis sp.]
ADKSDINFRKDRRPASKRRRPIANRNPSAILIAYPLGELRRFSDRREKILHIARIAPEVAHMSPIRSGCLFVDARQSAAYRSFTAKTGIRFPLDAPLWNKTGNAISRLTRRRACAGARSSSP